MHDPPRILIVDDNETNRDILATRLATQGYDLCQAADGEEALVSAKTLLPDLILLYASDLHPGGWRPAITSRSGGYRQVDGFPVPRQEIRHLICGVVPQAGQAGGP